MASTLYIAGQDIEIWYRRGFVDSVNSLSETHVWSEGGGGYIHPQHGGYINPPNVRSCVINSKEVRFTFDDNRRKTETLDARMTFEKDDDVSVFYANRAGSTTEYIVGVANHTEQKYWAVPPRRVVSFRASRALKIVWVAAVICVVLAKYCGSNEDSALQAAQRSELAQNVIHIQAAKYSAMQRYANETHRSIDLQTFLNCCYKESDADRAKERTYAESIANAWPWKDWWTEWYVRFFFAAPLFGLIGGCLRLVEGYIFARMVHERIGAEIQKIIGLMNFEGRKRHYLAQLVPTLPLAPVPLAAPSQPPRTKVIS